MRTDTLYRDPLVHSYMATDSFDCHHHEILQRLMRQFGLERGDKVLEIGAGFGRYTAWLVSYGLQVVATEPDTKFCAQLQDRFKDETSVTVVQADSEHLGEYMQGVKVLCGFHVLHHLNNAALQGLATVIEKGFIDAKGFAGWMFLEPNPLNPLFFLQVLTTPAMHFAEEKGVWMHDYNTPFRNVCADSCFMGAVGLFPPRKIVDSLPHAMQKFATSISRLPSVMRAYHVYGGNKLRTKHQNP